MPDVPLESRRIVGLRVDATSYDDATRRILTWADAGESRCVAVANTHSAVAGGDEPLLRAALDRADLVTPDGMPLVWGLRRLGVPDASRVYGPDLMLRVCSAAEREGVPIGLYGSTTERLPRLVGRLRDLFPSLEVAYAHSPSFLSLTVEEDLAVVEDIGKSGARILFVGLGCPKQELWMEEHRDRVRAVMLGVGAAFDFHAGEVRQAPALLQRMGLEWAFRLLMEPRRLWRRYTHVVPRFAWRFARQLASSRGR